MTGKPFWCESPDAKRAALNPFISPRASKKSQLLRCKRHFFPEIAGMDGFFIGLSPSAAFVLNFCSKALI
ncbi:hypothetical protein [Rhizobium sp. LCM 4573]|uniref:hypothetical protein n=1 Tax=Rhizobium sp. LCM 4573 TaxID=1848291 RepID=UPI000A7EA0ED|nr:hypothetical protein [Rhizobium sp. LCM 4573]